MYKQQVTSIPVSELASFSLPKNRQHDKPNIMHVQQQNNSLHISENPEGFQDVCKAGRLAVNLKAFGRVGNSVYILIL